MLQRGLKDKELQQLYLWVDGIPLSRPKKNMARDFSDAGLFNFNSVLVAQIISYHLPKIVQLHNYISTGSLQTKLSNWKTLNDKVLKKLKIVLTKQQINALANCESLYAQKLICLIKKAIEDQPQLSQLSRVTKSSKFKDMILPIPSQQKKPKVFTFKQILKNKDVKEIVTNKDQQIETLKQTLQLYALKFSKLDQIVKSKDRQIQELVKKIKNKGIM